MIRDICTKGRAQHLTDLLMYFWSNKKTKNMTKKCNISPRKFKNIESQKMVSKRLYGHYLRSYEQIKKNRILSRILRQLHKNQKKLIRKLDISRRKLKKRGTPNRVNPYLTVVVFENEK